MAIFHIHLSALQYSHSTNIYSTPILVQVLYWDYKDK